jgi:predicted DNA-binding protein (MmcQ/YjbR family)
MNGEDLADVLSGLPESTEEEPFAPGLPVYKVAGRVFAIYDPLSTPSRITLKCDPARALHLRNKYSSVVPGYHVNKRLWNTIMLDGSVPDGELVDLIRHSYEEAAAGLRKADRDRVLAQLDQHIGQGFEPEESG